MVYLEAIGWVGCWIAVVVYVSGVLADYYWIGHLCMMVFLRLKCWGGKTKFEEYLELCSWRRVLMSVGWWQCGGLLYVMYADDTVLKFWTKV